MSCTSWAELHREAALGPEMKLMLESGKERQVLICRRPGCEYSQVLELSEPVFRPGKWEHYPVVTHLPAGWRITGVICEELSHLSLSSLSCTRLSKPRPPPPGTPLPPSLSCSEAVGSLEFLHHTDPPTGWTLAAA